MNITRRGLILSATAALAVPSMARAAANGHSGAIFTHEGRALRGTDPVGYFMDGKVVAGSDEFQTQWMG